MICNIDMFWFLQQIWYEENKKSSSNAFVKSLASEERHDGNIVPDVLREGAERRAQSRNIYIYIFHNIGSRNS